MLAECKTCELVNPDKEKEKKCHGCYVNKTVHVVNCSFIRGKWREIKAINWETISHICNRMLRDEAVCVICKDDLPGMCN